MSDWTALYLPSSEYDPSKSGFVSSRAARKWVRKTYINRSCRRGCSKYYNTKWEKSVKWCYWVFIKTDKLKTCIDIGDVFDNSKGFIRMP